MLLQSFLFILTGAHFKPVNEISHFEVVFLTVHFTVINWKQMCMQVAVSYFVSISHVVGLKYNVSTFVCLQIAM